MILSTHIMQEVQAVCSRALIINHGELVGQGTLDELIQAQKGGKRYYVTIKTTREQIRQQINKLNDIEIERWEETNDLLGSRLVLRAHEAKKEYGEAIFQWVVANHWSLSELKSETLSLEDVFLKLTKEEGKERSPAL